VASQNYCICALCSGTSYKHSPFMHKYTITVAHRNLRRVLLIFCLCRQKISLDSRTWKTTSTRFSRRTTVSLHKPVSFWGRNLIPLSFNMRFCKNVFVLKEVRNTVAVFALIIFSINQKAKRAQLPAMRTTEQPMLLTKSKSNCPGYKFSTYFC